MATTQNELERLRAQQEAIAKRIAVLDRANVSQNPGAALATKVAGPTGLAPIDEERPQFTLPNIEKPKGSAGRDFNLQDALQLNESQHSYIRRSVKKTIGKILDLDRCMSRQAKHHISLAIREVLKIWPEFNALSDPEWPIREYIRTILKTSSEGHRNLLKKVAKPDEKGGSRRKKVIQQAAAPDPMPPAQLPKATPNEADENSDSTDSNEDPFSAPATTPATFSTADPVPDSTITHAHTASKLPAQLVAQTLPHGQLSTESHAPMGPNLSSPPPSPSNVPTNTKKNKSKEKEKGSGSGSKGKSRARESDSEGSDLADPNPDYTRTTMDLYSNLTDKDEQISANSVSEPTQSESVPMPVPEPKMKIRPRPKEKPYPEPEPESVPAIPAPPPAPIPTVAPTVPAKRGKRKRVDIDTPSLPSTSAPPTHDPAPTDEPPAKKGRKGAAALKTPARPQLAKNFSSPMVATPTRRSTRIINNSKDINSGLFNIRPPTKKSNPAPTRKKSRK